MLTVNAQVIGTTLEVRDAIFVAGFDPIEERNDVTLSLAGNILTVAATDGVDPGGAVVASVDFDITAGGGIDSILVDLQGDDDTLTFNGSISLGATVTGGDPGSGSDTLFLVDAGGAGQSVIIEPDAVDSSAQDIAGFGSNIDSKGFEVINYRGTGDNDFLNVRVEGDDDVRIDAAAISDTDRVTSNSLPTIEVSGVSGLTIDGSLGGAVVATFAIANLSGATQYNTRLGADQTLAIEGTVGADNLEVSDPAPVIEFLRVLDVGSSNAVGVSLAGTPLGQLIVNSLGGSDNITVLENATANVPLVIDGGDPLAAVGDTLTIETDDTVSFTPGPQADEGAVVTTRFVSGNANQSISFSHIEAVNVVGTQTAAPLIPSAVTIQGTGGDDQITIQGVGVRSFDVTVNDGPTQRYTNVDNVAVESLGGDDDIDIDVEVANLGVTFDIDGGLPTSLGDTVRVTGVDDSGPIVRDNAIWSPIDIDPFSPTSTSSGTLSFGAAVNNAVINVVDIERVVYDGELQDDLLTIQGTTFLGADLNDRFIHTPGAAPDAGTVAINPLGQSAVLGIEYVNLGANIINTRVQFDGLGGDDTLVAFGTDGTDTIDVSFSSTDAANIGLDSPLGSHLNLTTTLVENYEIEALDGDDVIQLQGIVDISGSLSVHGGNPAAGSDTLQLRPQTADLDITVAPDTQISTNQDITGYGGAIDVVGVEVINLDGLPRGPVMYDLIVNLGEGNAEARVQSAALQDFTEVISDVLPRIEFSLADTFTLQAAEDPTVATFVMDDIDEGAERLEFEGLRDRHTLVIEGNNEINDTTVSLTNGGNLRVSMEGTAVIGANMNDLDRLVINTLDGDDTLTVDVDATDLIDVPITYDGGLGDDELIVTGSPTTTVDEVVYDVGPGPGDGRLTYEDDTDTVLMVVDFVNLEPVVDNVPSAVLTVNGTNADNAINYGPGNLPTTGLVSVDNFETIEFSNKGTLVLNGGAGHDNINVDNFFLPAGLTAIQVNGDAPAAPDGGADTVTIAGLGGVFVDDAPVWAPSLLGGGTLTLASGLTIGVATTEEVIYDGMLGDSSLTVQGTVLSDRFVHTPGTAPNAGSVSITPFGQAPLLGISYQNLGTDILGTDVVIAGGPLPDTLVALGTAGNDLMTVEFNGLNQAEIDLASIFGFHLDLETVSVANYIIETLDGDDNIVFLGAIDATGLATVHGGNPSAGSDTLFLVADSALDVTIGPSNLVSSNQVVTGFGAPLTVTGTEVINFDGDNQADLTIDPGNGIANVRVQNGALPSTDVVISDVMPNIEFDDVVDFTLEGGSAPTFATFFMDDLAGAANYFFDGSGDTHTLIIEDDDDPGNGNISLDNNGDIVISLEGETVTALNMNENDRIQVNTFDGDDTLTVDVDTTDLIGTPITYDGGLGDDLLTVTGTPSTTVDELIYDVGPGPGDGTLTYEDDTDTTLMVIDFVNLEPVIENVPAATLTVNANNADNSITYSQGAAATSGLVAVDDFETIDFTNKGVLELFGQGGSDTFTITNPFTPTGLTNVVVHGAPNDDDKLSVVAVAGTDDVLRFTPTAQNSGTVEYINSPPAPVNFDGIEALELVLQQTDTDEPRFRGTNGDDQIEFFPGDTQDSGRFVGTLDFNNDTGVGPFPMVPTTYVGAQPGGDIDVNLRDGTDTFIYNGTDGDDVIDVSPAGGTAIRNTVNGNLLSLIDVNNSESALVRGLNGSDTFNHDASVDIPVTYEGGNPDNGSDVLNFNGTGNDITVDLDARTITEAGSPPVTISGIETVNIDAAGGALTVAGTALDDTITYRPTGTEAGTFQNENDNTEFNFSNVSGDFTVNGLADAADQVIVEGTNNHDVITVDSPNRTVTVENVAGTILKPVVLGTTTELVTAKALLGNDTILVVPAVGIAPLPLGNLGVFVDGGPPGASDALVIAADAAGNPLANNDNFVIVHRGRNPNEGVVRVYQRNNIVPLSPIQLPDIIYTDIEVVSPLLDVPNDAAGDPNLLILGPDQFEPNEFRTTAAFVGSGSNLNVTDLAIFPFVTEHRFVPADRDWFRYVAAETGTLDFQVYFEAYNPQLLPDGGNLDIQVYDVNGNLIATSASGTDNERIAIPVVRNETYYLRVAGATPDVVNGYDMTVINVPAPTPQVVDLTAATDSGRNNTDDITNFDANINPATVYNIVLDDDRIDEFNLLNLLPDNVDDDLPTVGFDYGVEVFNNGVSIGFAYLIGGNTWQFTATAGDLVEGDGNFISAAVWIRDRATPNVLGRAELSVPLQVELDTIAPASPTGQIDAANTDTGIPGAGDTFSDAITSDTNTGFTGTAEADSIVRMWADGDPLSDMAIDANDVFQGLTVAVPLDGNLAFPNGQWDLAGQFDLNDANAGGVGFPIDGVRQIGTTAEDVAGNVSTPSFFDIFIDTAGPQVTSVFLTNNPGYDLFDPKPSVDGPTPPATQMTITVQDLPPRAVTALASFLYDPIFAALATNPGHYSVVGDHSGQIPIASVQYLPAAPANGQVATAQIVLTFESPLPDDRYTLTLSDELSDRAGNKLDGESNALQPLETPIFPSGNRIPGGNFEARFTIDSRPEIGTTCCGGVTVDINGNFEFDPQGNDNDFTNRDLTFLFGETSDALFAGNFAPAGAISASGFDKLGAYGFFNGAYRFLLDFDHDGVADFASVSGFQIAALPVAGDFAPAHPGDEIGLFDGSTWYLDTNGDNVLNGLDTVIASNLVGLPIVGDFNGDNSDDLATYDAGSNTFFFDLDRNDTADDSLVFGFTGFLERPVAGDLNLDGIDDLGLWVPGREAQIPQEAAEWWFLVSDRQAALPSQVFDAYSPAPLGNDLFAQFGDEDALPIFGNFDPPLTENPSSLVLTTTTSNLVNTFARLEVTGATPGEYVYFVSGFAPGTAAVPGSFKESVDIADHNYLGRAVADANGYAFLDVWVPAHVDGKPVYVQAVDLAADNTSDVYLETVGTSSGSLQLSVSVPPPPQQSLQSSSSTQPLAALGPAPASAAPDSDQTPSTSSSTLTASSAEAVDQALEQIGDDDSLDDTIDDLLN